MSSSGIAVSAVKTGAPPYLVAGTSHVIVGVAWDKAAILDALPSWLTPADGMTGAINIYQSERGYGLSPYQAAYFWVDVEGHDSPSGVKGRWMLQGIYGPRNEISAALREWAELPVRNGTSRFEATAAGKRAIGTLDGEDFVTLEIQSLPESCRSESFTLNYLSPKGLLEIPVTGEVCEAKPIRVEVHARAGTPFAAFQPLETLWGIELKNGTFCFPRPQPLTGQATLSA